MIAYKFYIVGTFNAGKTQFIRSISEIDVVNTQRLEDMGKTIMGMDYGLDYGRLTVDNDYVMYFFGHPNRRLDFSIEFFSIDNFVGVILVVDSVYPETFRAGRFSFDHLERTSPFPYVIAANFQDHPNAWSPDDLRAVMKIPNDVPIIPCVATDKHSVAQVLIALCKLVLAESDTDA